jgi:hypothetical protein
MFILAGILGNSGSTGTNEIVINEAQVQRLIDSWSAVWRRPPTEQELTGLIDDFITEEVLYREALAIGLENDDQIIRRRLRQKMEFISEDLSSQLEPTEQELREYLEANRDYFEIEPKLTFAHIYLNPDKIEGNLEKSVQKLASRLSPDSARTPSSFGDPFPLPYQYQEESHSEITKTFGIEFSDALLEIEPGKWVGPISSGYGYHLVFLTERQESRFPELEEVKDIVKREWLMSRRREINQEFINRLRGKYSISLDLPETILSKGQKAEASE